MSIEDFEEEQFGRIAVMGVEKRKLMGGHRLDLVQNHQHVTFLLTVYEAIFYWNNWLYRQIWS